MILIPAAGRGQRFQDAGYTVPKHLIELDGTPLIELVAENLRVLEPDGELVVVTRADVGDTRGIVETIVRSPVMPGEIVVGNCDQLLLLPRDDSWKQGDGVLFTFWSQNPAHSYVLTDARGRIEEIREKIVVSSRAVSGVYWFRDSFSLVEACREVCETAAGELYLSAALRLMLDDGADLFAVDAPTAILGTPEDLQRFQVALELAKVDRCF
jgi:dTDP-glucose pyrophosphorylase